MCSGINKFCSVKTCYGTMLSTGPFDEKSIVMINTQPGLNMDYLFMKFDTIAE